MERDERDGIGVVNELESSYLHVSILRAIHGSIGWNGHGARCFPELVGREIENAFVVAELSSSVASFGNPQRSSECLPLRSGGIDNCTTSRNENRRGGIPFLEKHRRVGWNVIDGSECHIAIVESYLLIELDMVVGLHCTRQEQHAKGI